MSYIPSAPESLTARLPDGVVVRELHDRGDHASRTTELYRADWPIEVPPVQWNLVSSRPSTLRGVHVHVDHWDYLSVVSGEMLLGLHDMRPRSPTYKLAAQQLFQGKLPVSIAIPPGVAHGFYFGVTTTYLYAVSHYWNPADELGCRWNDPDLGLSWPVADPLLSPRDAGASSYGELVRAFAAATDRSALHS